MRANSAAGEAKNNNHDPTLRDHESGKGPAQTTALLRDDLDADGSAKGPSDNRQGRKD